MPRICWQTIFICGKPQRYDKPLKQLGLLSRQADIRRVTGASSVNLRQAVGAKLDPEVMAPPLLWLVSDAAGKVTGRRFLGVHWDPELPPEQAAEKAGAPVAWTSIATMPITPSRS